MRISGRLPAVVVEYDCRGKRVEKKFDSPYKARRFYAQKLNDGKNPTLKGIER